MNNIKVLDCTLRDGGRIINCEFDDQIITNMAKDLSTAGIDIVEMGFLRSEETTSYTGNSTFFTSPNQIAPLLPPETSNTMFVAFADYNMYDFSALAPKEENSIQGIRIGFTRKDFMEDLVELKRALRLVKEQGYLLFAQGVNVLAYSDQELLRLIDVVNEIEPYSFGIVDTYGAMYLEDIERFYCLVDENLKEGIAIDIHSHNNFQSSFTFAQEIIRLAKDEKRMIIIDATLNGMGKCAGNLNTELIIDFLSRKQHRDYELDGVLDAIDRYILPIRQSHSWGYSVPAFMAGIYKSHPNNITYLTEKYRLNSKDIKYIISGIDEKTRERYDYDNIHRIYKQYNKNKIDEEQSIQTLKKQFKDTKVLVLAPGKTVDDYQEQIQRYIMEQKPCVVGVNFIPKKILCDYYFYANTIHWEKIQSEIDKSRCILSSNIHRNTEGTKQVDYASLIVEDSKLFDNSAIMLLNLLKKLEVASIHLAGFDGLKEVGENYVGSDFLNKNHELSMLETNQEVGRLYDNYKKKVKGKIKVRIITPSMYEDTDFEDSISSER
ncbi:MAG: aldolase catalytic domain-containing protein [Lachnospiraceae bacterium]